MTIKNIILIGMPGAGKSTIGVLLAKIIGYQFIDSDLIIQSQENKLLNEIIETEGLEGFIDIENKVNCNLKLNKTVLATGGSAIYGVKAMNYFKSIGTIIYIKLSCETLKDRIGSIKCRGVVLKNNQTFDDLYIERCPLYEKYRDITIDAENKTIEEIIEKITENLTIK